MATLLDALGSAARLPGGIPRLIHRVWLGIEVPPETLAYGTDLQRLHPGWLVVLWRDWTLPALDNQEAFDRSPHASQRSNIVRYEVLRRWGGVYVDTDVEPRRPLDSLLEHESFAIAREDDRWLGTAFMASAPAHPFVTHLCATVGRSVLDAPPGTPSNVVAGPKFVTRSLERWRADGGDPVTILPAPLVYPYHFTEPERRAEAFPDAYLVHHWAASWVG